MGKRENEYFKISVSKQVLERPNFLPLDMISFYITQRNLLGCIRKKNFILLNFERERQTERDERFVVPLAYALTAFTGRFSSTA